MKGIINGSKEKEEFQLFRDEVLDTILRINEVNC
jgi:hypothetical protein